MARIHCDVPLLVEPQTTELQPARRRSARRRDDTVDRDRTAVRQQQPVARADRMAVVQFDASATHPVCDPPPRARPVAGEKLVARRHETDLAVDAFAVERVPYGQRDFDAGRARTDHGDPESGTVARRGEHARPALEEIPDRAQRQQPITERLEPRRVDLAADVQ